MLPDRPEAQTVLIYFVLLIAFPNAGRSAPLEIN
jgi:hypothetical protein